MGGVLHAQSESLHHAADAAYRRRRRSVVKFRRLYDLIKNNYSYLVFQALKDLKAELSSHDTARLDIPEIDIDLTVSREHFEDIILPVLTELQAAIVTILQRANIKAEQIQLVLRTGGSSLIPAVKRLLDKSFPDKVIEHDLSPALLRVWPSQSIGSWRSGLQRTGIGEQVLATHGSYSVCYPGIPAADSRGI